MSWPHAPLHQLSEQGVYFVTAGTFHREHHFRGTERLKVLQRGLLKLCREFDWRLEAWAIFSNHYHFVAHSPQNQESATTLSDLLSILHVRTTRWVNRLTHQTSYFARLNYVHQNPVKHGLVPVANQYPWCSARWFERTTSHAMVKSIYRFKTDKMQVGDEYEPAQEW